MGTPQFYIKYAYEILAIALPLVWFILCRKKITSANRFTKFLKWSLLLYVVGEFILLGSDFIFTRLKLQDRGTISYRLYFPFDRLYFYRRIH